MIMVYVKEVGMKFLSSKVQVVPDLEIIRRCPIILLLQTLGNDTSLHLSLQCQNVDSENGPVNNGHVHEHTYPLLHY